jgi:hypothetical protein
VFDFNDDSFLLFDDELLESENIFLGGEAPPVAPPTVAVVTVLVGFGGRGSVDDFVLKVGKCRLVFTSGSVLSALLPPLVAADRLDLEDRVRKPTDFFVLLGLVTAELELDEEALDKSEKLLEGTICYYYESRDRLTTPTLM